MIENPLYKANKPYTKIIKFFSDWSSPSQLKEGIEKMCNVQNDPDYGIYKKYYITDEDNYTHVIILNACTPQLLSIPKENIVGLAQEPFYFLRYVFSKYVDFIEYAKTNIGKYYIGDKPEILQHSPFSEGCNYILYNTPIELPIQKTKIMSIMISNKNYNTNHPYYAPGHAYRHNLVKSILNTKLPIDIYGRGCQYYENIMDDRIKGTFEKNEPYEIYQFHVCIENFQSNYYFSEKIINPLLCEATPIYLGCSNIERYFPDKTIILTGNEKMDMFILEEICKKPDYYKKNINQSEIEEIVNPLKNLDKIFA
jgi:hypothetical protein